MRRFTSTASTVGALFLSMFLGAGVAAQEFTAEFSLDDCMLSDSGRNAYFSLTPGDQLVLEGEEGGETTVVQITVLRDRKMIRFRTAEGELLTVRTRVVEEREWKDDVLVEVSRNFFARCVQTNDVYYFGEDVNIYEDGEISHEGSWRAGVDGALPGLIMPGTFLLGSRYFQESAPGVALDRAEHLRMGFEMETPAGAFDDCVEVVETSELDAAAESSKIYCEDIGLVEDSGLQLVELDIEGADDEGDDEGEHQHDGDQRRSTRRDR